MGLIGDVVGKVAGGLLGGDKKEKSEENTPFKMENLLFAQKTGDSLVTATFKMDDSGSKDGNSIFDVGKKALGGLFG